MAITHVTYGQSDSVVGSTLDETVFVRVYVYVLLSVVWVYFYCLVRYILIQNFFLLYSIGGGFKLVHRGFPPLPALYIIYFC